MEKVKDKKNMDHIIYLFWSSSTLATRYLWFQYSISICSASMPIPTPLSAMRLKPPPNPTSLIQVWTIGVTYHTNIHYMGYMVMIFTWFLPKGPIVFCNLLWLTWKTKTQLNYNIYNILMFTSSFFFWIIISILFIWNISFWFDFVYMDI